MMALAFIGEGQERKSAGGQRNSLKRLKMAKRIQENQSLFLDRFSLRLAEVCRI
jgi:hypothetical protein